MSLKLSDREAKNILDATIRTNARGYAMREQCDDAFPYGIEQVNRCPDGQIDTEDLCQKIYDDITMDMKWNPATVQGVRAIPDFSVTYIQGVIDDANLFDNALCSDEITLLQSIYTQRATLLKGYDIKNVKDSKTGDLFNMRIPKDATKYDLQKGDDDPVGETHTGKKVYFHPGGEPIISGRVTGHGKDGVTIRDGQNKRHTIEHGGYQVHKADPEQDDFGEDDYGDEDKKDPSGPPEFEEDFRKKKKMTKAIIDVVTDRLEKAKLKKYEQLGCTEIYKKLEQQRKEEPKDV